MHLTPASIGAQSDESVLHFIWWGGSLDGSDLLLWQASVPAWGITVSKVDRFLLRVTPEFELKLGSVIEDETGTTVQPPDSPMFDQVVGWLEQFPCPDSEATSRYLASAIHLVISPVTGSRLPRIGFTQRIGARLVP